MKQLKLITLITGFIFSHFSFGVNNHFKFKKQKTFDLRVEEASKVRDKYPNRIPVICERAEKSDVPEIDKSKYLVPVDLTVGQFVYVIRNRIKLAPEQAVFVFINDVMPPTASLMSEVYDQQKDADGFLYIKYSGENTFG